MPVGVLLESMSSRELSEWMAFFSIEGPTGDERADWQAGMVASTVANVNRDPKKQKRPYRPEDFMPRFAREHTPEQEPQTQQADPGLLAFVRGMQRRMGGRLVVDGSDGADEVSDGDVG